MNNNWAEDEYMLYEDGPQAGASSSSSQAPQWQNAEYATQGYQQEYQRALQQYQQQAAQQSRGQTMQDPYCPIWEAPHQQTAKNAHEYMDFMMEHEKGSAIYQTTTNYEQSPSTSTQSCSTSKQAAKRKLEGTSNSSGPGPSKKSNMN